MRDKGLLGGSWDLVSKVISTLNGVISIVTLIITLVYPKPEPPNPEKLKPMFQTHGNLVQNLQRAKQ